MTYILVIGDTHIPDRANSIPDKLLNIVLNGIPWDIVVFTGDLTSEDVYKWVLKLGREVHIVSGNMDYIPLPESRVFVINNIAIGVYHGTSVYPRGDTKGLTNIAWSLGVKLLFTGHTHSFFLKKGTRDDILLVNPGSLTGVWGGGGGSMKPSMIVLELYNNVFKYIFFELSRERLFSRENRVYYRDNKWFIE